MNKLLIGILTTTLLAFLTTGCVPPSAIDIIDNSDPSGSDDTTSNEIATVAQWITEIDTHENTDDCSWDPEYADHIVFNDSTIDVDTAAASVDGSTVTISAAGTYVLSGYLSDGQVVVSAPDNDDVQLVLSDLTIHNSTSAAIFVRSADEVNIILEDNTDNELVDSSSYVFNDTTDEPRATLFSKADLTICGGGSLVVEGNYNDAISSQDGLIISGGIISVDAVDDGIRGKDYVVVHDGTITVEAGGNGLISDNNEDTGRGFILVEGGDINVVSDGDAISAAAEVMISGGSFDLSSGGSSDGPFNSSTSAKGIKSSTSMIIDAGVFDISSADDALHSNGTMTVNGGEVVIDTGDDGAHADKGMYINDGQISITKSYEGLESNTSITINGGDIHIISSDDGINVASGIDGSGNGGPGFPGGRFPHDGQSTSDCTLHINGGYIAIDAEGDGIDANGAVTMSGGSVLVDGPTANNNGALDHASFTINGGLLVAVGSAGMPGAPSTTSTQRSIMITYQQWRQAGTIIHIEASDEDAELLTYTPSKAYQSCVFSSPALQAGMNFALYQGGSSTGTATDGLHDGADYTGGTLLGYSQTNNIVTRVSTP